MSDYKQNPDYIRSRRRGLLFGWLSLLSFPLYILGLIVFMAALSLIKVDFHYGLVYLMLGSWVAIGLAIFWFVRSQKYRKAALAIRYPDTYKVKLPKQFRE